MKRSLECRREYFSVAGRGCSDVKGELREVSSTASCGAKRGLLYIVLLLITAAFPVWPQQAAQTPSPMVENTRPHPRITQTEVPGRRIELKTLKGTRLF